MINALKKIDVFGVPFNLNTYGKTKHSTKTGGVLTCISLCIIGTFTYLFGTDFFHKENPNLVESQLVHKQTKPIDVANDKFSFMFRLQDGNSKPFLDRDSMPYGFWGGYFHMKKNQNKEFEQVCWARSPHFVTLCSNTKATENIDLKEERLDQWFCWDMEKITSECKKQMGYKDPKYKPHLGGFNDEEEYSAFRLDVNNFHLNQEMTQKEKIATREELLKFPQITLNLRFPNINYDATKPRNPLQVFYDSKTHFLLPGNFRRELRFMQLATSVDDQGWVFQSKDSFTTMIPDKAEPEFYSWQNNEGAAGFYNGFFYNVKKEKLFMRSFMKLQGLAAEVGGVVKSIMGVFAFYAIYQAQEERDEMLENEFYTVKVKQDSDKSQLSSQNDATKVNTVVNLHKNVESNKTKFSFWDYLCKFCRKTVDQERHAKIRKQLHAYMREKFDVRYLVKMFEEFTMIKDLVLTEEQKELLENKKTQVHVEA